MATSGVGHSDSPPFHAARMPDRACKTCFDDGLEPPRVSSKAHGLPALNSISPDCLFNQLNLTPDQENIQTHRLAILGVALYEYGACGVENPVAMIDVLLPVYNAADSLDESLKSLADQSFGDFRVIAIDDGSIDDSPEILKSWAARDPRFTFIAKANGGIVEALNTGLSAVTAKYTARLDADDIALPDRFAKQIDYLESNPGCVAVGCRVQHIDGAGQILQGFPHPGSPDEADMWRIPAREPYIIHPFMMARSDALHHVGGYRYVPHSEDSDLFWRLSERGRLHNLPETLGHYRMHLDSISGSSIVNGRIMAVGSQLGALSARRRFANKPDLHFGSDLMAQLRHRKELHAMCDDIALGLDSDESAFFRLSTAIKLLELADYRPYEIERSDCIFIRDALEPAIRAVNAENFRDIGWYLSRTGSRLLRAGRPRDALTLVPTRLWLRTGAKAVLSV